MPSAAAARRSLPGTLPSAPPQASAASDPPWDRGKVSEWGVRHTDLDPQPSAAARAQSGPSVSSSGSSASGSVAGSDAWAREATSVAEAAVVVSSAVSGPYSSAALE